MKISLNQNTMHQKLFSLLAFTIMLNAIGMEGYSQPFVYRKIPADMLAPFVITDNEYNSIMAASTGYYDIVNSLPSNYVTDGSVDYTEHIQKALNTNRSVIFPPFPILVSIQYDQGAITIPSNSNLVFPKGAKLLLKPSFNTNYQVLRIHYAENVKVYYPVIKGDRFSHLGTTGEWGMGISIMGSKNIQIEKPYITDCWGDGIYIATTNAPVMISKNVSINGAILDNNRRCGLAIISGDNLYLNNILCANTNGTAPRAGVDIEPNNNADTIRRITFNNIIAYNNHSFGFEVVLFHLRGTLPHTDIDIKVNGLKTYYSAYPIGFNMYNSGYSGGTPLGGKVAFTNVFMNDYMGRPFEISDNSLNTVPVCVSFGKAANKSLMESFYATEIKKSTNYSMNCDPMPVATFENIGASVSNGQLSVKWNTVNEIYSDHFEIELSKDSTNFKKIGSIRSLATDYNSAPAYTFNMKLQSALGTFAFAPLGLFCLIFFKRVRKRMGIFFITLPLLFYCACRKETPPNVEVKEKTVKYFIKIVQIDGDGNEFSSPVISFVVPEIQK